MNVKNQQSVIRNRITVADLLGQLYAIVLAPVVRCVVRWYRNRRAVRRALRAGRRNRPLQKLIATAMSRPGHGVFACRYGDSVREAPDLSPVVCPGELTIEGEPRSDEQKASLAILARLRCPPQ